MDDEKAPEQQPGTFTMPTELVQRVINYLQDRPYKEVASLIREIMARNPSS